MAEKIKAKFKILPALVGNLLEWYDFTLYSYFSVIFATQFFPTQDKYSSLLSVYLLLGISFIMRPIGALLFGYIGDKISRKHSLYYSIILMASCSFLVSILPTYQEWGIMAGIALAFIRLLQGLAIGGEYSGATTYVIESAPTKHLTFFGSLCLASSYFGFLISALIGTSLTFIFSPTELASYGWRVGFAFGGLLALVGFYMRKEFFNQHKQEDTQPHPINPLKELYTSQRKNFLLALGTGLLPAGFSYLILVYFLNILENQGYTMQQVFYINTVAIFALVISIPLIGYLGDKIGRKVLMISGVIGTLLFCIPLFHLLFSHPFLSLIFFTLLNALFEACLPTEIAGLFPKSCRYSGLALTLNLTNGVAGGMAPLIAATLIHYTGIPISPLFYIIALSAISLCSIAVRMKQPSQFAISQSSFEELRVAKSIRV